MLRSVVFLACLLCLYMVGYYTYTVSSGTAHTYITQVALPCDLLIVIPLAFYFSIIRKNQLSPLLMTIVFWIGSAMLTALMGYQGLPTLALILMGLVLFLEAAIVIHEIRKYIKLFKIQYDATCDIKESFETIFFDATKNKRASKMISGELAMLHYALFSWKKKAVVPSGCQSFTYHEKSAYSSLVLGIACILPIETIVVHMALAQWNTSVAWVVTFLSIYSLIWFIGDYRCSVLKPILVSNNQVDISVGLFLSHKIPLESIAHVGTKSPDLPKADFLNYARMGQSICWIEFHEPQSIETLLSTKKVKAICITVDDSSRFISALS